MALSEAKQRRRSGVLGLAERKLGPFALFLRGFLKHPGMVGSVIPSSQALVENMLSRVDWANVRLFVEYGPGVGTFSRRILDRLRPDALLIAIDTNEEFARYLSREIADSRLLAVHGSAVDVREVIRAHGFDQADYVLSGLPFSTLPPGIGEAIMTETEAALKPGGAFLVYQYSRRAFDLLRQHFPRIDQGVTLWNIPPCRMFWAWKGEAVSRSAIESSAAA